MRIFRARAGAGLGLGGETCVASVVVRAVAKAGPGISKAINMEISAHARAAAKAGTRPRAFPAKECAYISWATEKRAAALKAIACGVICEWRRITHSH